MKRNSRTVAVIVAGCARTAARRGLLICALFSLVMIAAGGRATAGPSTAVSLTEADNIVGEAANHLFAAGIFEGTIGTEAVSGTTSMDVRVVGNTFHCVHTWTASDGSTLIINSDCNMMTLNGQWRVVYGDGMFANFFAQGSLVMALNGFDLDGVQYQVAEILSGTVH
jgi:hypothetical protein